MSYKCDECDSTFREKKNLQQHRRKNHGLKKSRKCEVGGALSYLYENLSSKLGVG